MITIFKTVEYRDADIPFHVEIEAILRRIKSGKVAAIIEQVRAEDDKSAANIIKKKLPAICFSGKFSRREDSAIMEHSGFICLDFDGFPDGEIDTWRDTLEGDQYTYACFMSPSGNGFKVITRIPKDIDNHKLYFRALQAKWGEYFDPTSVNISRVCYESSDPQLYVNTEAPVWTDMAEDGRSYIEEVPLLPINDEQRIIDNLMKWFDKGYPMTEGVRNQNAFILASAFNEYGVSKMTAEGVLARYQSDGFPFKEIQGLVRSAYTKSAQHGTKFFEDNTTKQHVKRSLGGGKKPDDVAKELVSRGYDRDTAESAVEVIQSESNDDVFWMIGDNNRVIISPGRFAQWLQGNGFYKYYPESVEQPTFVRVTNNIVDEIGAGHIKDFTLNSLKQRGEHRVWDFMANKTALFSDNYLSMLDSVELSILRDLDGRAFFCFENGVLEVSKDTCHMIEYLDAPGYIWRSHIMPREFTPSDDIGSDFARLVSNVCQGDKGRTTALEQVIGYLMHSFKDKSQTFAVIFNDQEINDDPNGGSGKSLVLYAIKMFRNMEIINGKSFDPLRSNFTYQRLSADTQILAFDDVRKNFDFEQLFSLITEGIEIERKGKDAVYIPFERSPKVVITTNYVISGSGNSNERRRKEVEFYQHYNNTNTPRKEFGKLLFDEWSAADWSQFDNYMVACCMNYLTNGMPESKGINIEVKRFIQSTCKEFYDWVTEGNVPINVRMYSTEQCAAFGKENRDFEKLSSRKFLIWVKKHADFVGLEVLQGKDGGGRWFELIEKGTTKENPLDYFDGDPDEKAPF